MDLVLTNTLPPQGDNRVTGGPVLLPTQGTAIAALVASIVAWPVGLVLSFIALSKIKRTGFAGRGLAVAAIAVSGLGIVASVLLFPLVLLVAGAVGTTVPEMMAALDSPIRSNNSTATETTTPSATPTPTPTSTPRSDETAVISLATDADTVAPGTGEGTIVGIGELGSTADGIGFTVEGVECGIATVGGAGLATTASGQFCEVDVVVTNNGPTSYRFNYVDARGSIGLSQYSASASASVYSDSAWSFGVDISPGSSVQSSVYFDLPVGQSLESVTFSDGFVGGHVQITL
ncbi:MAG: hypothetical protein JWQ43_4091 [Glaciihabitans sp.]|nr:hypothetical protein [Glaciihabitans sp.]